MAARQSPFGADLAVVPDFVAADSSTRDLVHRLHVGPVVTADGRVENRAADIADLDTLSGRDNLAQALLLRLLTPLGSLTPLGHPEYGSRLTELIGRNKTAELRVLCKAHVLEAVAREPRVEDEAVAFAFDAAAETPDSLVFTVQVRGRGLDDGPVGVSVEVGL